VTPISDVRGSERYRRTLAANILVKFWHEAVGGANGSGDGQAPQPPPPQPRVRKPRLVRKGRG
jgi:hypothetical protein